MKPLQAAYWYFSAVFTVAFLLKPVDLLWFRPHFGPSGAEWAEAGLMLLATVVSARWVVLKLDEPASPRRRLSVGLFALALIVVTQLTVDFWIRRLSVQEFFNELDALALVTYGVSLLAFTIMPLLMGRE